MGKLSCGGSFMKCLLFIFNLFFWLCGAGLITFGIILLVDDDINKYLEIITWDQNDPTLEAAAIALICVGVFIFLVGFMGCCGAWKENSCMLCTYCTLVVFVMLGELAAVVLAIIFKTQFGDEVRDHMQEDAKTNVKNVYESPDPVSAAWHYMQVELKCCGGVDYKDYKDNSNFTAGAPVPLTCCVLSNNDAEDPQPVDQTQCYQQFNNASADGIYLHKTGCYGELKAFFDEYAWILIGVGCGVILLQVLGIVFACCVRKELNEYGMTT